MGCNTIHTKNTKLWIRHQVEQVQIIQVELAYVKTPIHTLRSVVMEVYGHKV
jgi:hypothetical protein